MTFVLCRVRAEDCWQIDTKEPIIFRPSTDGLIKKPGFRAGCFLLIFPPPPPPPPQLPSPSFFSLPSFPFARASNMAASLIVAPSLFALPPKNSRYAGYVVSTQTINYLSIMHNFKLKPYKMYDNWIKELSSRTLLPWQQLILQSNTGIKIIISNIF